MRRMLRLRMVHEEPDDEKSVRPSSPGVSET